ncbi:MAG: phosphoenolpyruvate--protein phosphotransferase [Polyangia bacterium]
MTTTHLVVRGTAVSGGVAQGPAHVLTFTDHVPVTRRTLDPTEVQGELDRLDRALAQAEEDLLSLGKTMAAKVGAEDAEVFAAQALVARDHVLHGQIVTLVRDHHVNVEAAVAEVIDRFTKTFDQIADPYIRERAADIRDVGRRVLAALGQQALANAGAPGTVANDFPDGAILVVDELLPSATASLELGRTRALVTDRGGKFSHTSILARSMRMPAVTGVQDATLKIKNGDHVIVDGVSGVVFVNPGPSVRREYDRLEAELRGYRAELEKLVERAAVTRDGVAITLLANASKLSDTEAAVLYKADGIGLYRTEFGFAVRSAFPTEDDQYEILKRAADRIHPRKIVVRLLDVGGDKELSYFPLPVSRNPSLGQRGMRLLLQQPDILRTQLRAFLRVSADRAVSILLPMVGGVDEIRATRVVLNEVMEELTREGKPFNPQVPLGAMVEVPAAAVMAAVLAREVDFLSLGTNDLVQYVLAADREDDTVASYYRPLHPAVLHLIRSVCDGAGQASRPLTICGEMAGDPANTELLLGLGLREFSVAPGEMLEVKDAIRKADLGQARALADEALGLASADEVETLLARRRATGTAAGGSTGTTAPLA